VKITQLSDRLHIEINGELFSEYFFQDVPRPYYYPLIGPGGVAMTRNWPMKTTPNEDHDHPHHRSLWFAHGAVNGQDFWSEQKGFGKIVHDGFDEVKSGKKEGIIRSKDKWVAASGAIVCTDERILRIYRPASPGERLFDFEITLHASNGDVVFGDTKEGAMAVRDDETWGKRADWCDYYGPVDGKTAGLAIFDHPQNPRHPTWWHVRDYGLFAANPFGQHDFEKLSDKSAGNLTIPAGKSVTFRYRFYLHAGDDQQGKVSQKYQDYVKSK
jgi:hypothetical protein